MLIEITIVMFQHIGWTNNTPMSNAVYIQKEIQLPSNQGYEQNDNALFAWRINHLQRLSAFCIL
jgi:hypothetical protein